MTNFLMVLGCVLGVIGGAAPSSERFAGLPVDWTLAVLGALLLLTAFVLRLRSGRGAEHQAKSSGSVSIAREALGRTPAGVKAILARATTLPMQQLSTEINVLIERDVKPVIDAQAALIQTQGFARYAAHTGPWATGERMLYRAWSAATDGHRPEAIASLTEALPHFEDAVKAF